MKDFFKPSDFIHFYGASPAEMAAVANRKLEMEIEKAKTVYFMPWLSDPDDQIYGTKDKPGDTHSAKLMFIEPKPTEET